MSNAHLTQYQALHLDKDRLTFDKCMTIKPATLFLDNYPKEHIHNWRCLKMLDVIQETWPDLTETPFSIRDPDLFTDNSFICEGIRYTGAVIFTS